MLSTSLNRHIMMKRIISLTVLFIFFSCFILAEAPAAVEGESVPYEMSGEGLVRFARLDINTFTIPAHLGEVKYAFKGASDKFVIHLQDAHCNWYAQRKIFDIIDYLNKEYGIRVVNLEGGAGAYDLTVFTSITGEAIRMEVADYFVKKGEINGAELYAINNPDRVTLWGVEDKDLYLANLEVYRDSLAYKEEVNRYLRELTHIMNNLKRHIYTPELLKVDMAYNAYKEGNMDFREYLEFLITEAKKEGIKVKQFTNLNLLAQAMGLEERIDFKKANADRDMLIEELKKGLSKNEAIELVTKSVDFKTKKISRKTFYDYLLEKAKAQGLDINRFPSLLDYIVYVTTYEAVDRSKIMEELAELEIKIREPLYRNDTQRRLDTLSHDLAITKNIFAIRLNKTDYKYYLANKSSFDVSNYLEFIRKEAYKYRISARPSADIWKLDDYREEISKFYEYSFRRDEIFLKNLRFGSVAENVKGAALMTGGFHTESLCELLEKEGISYVSILPRFTSARGYECPYFDLLAGQTTDLQRMLSSVIAQAAMMQIASRLSPILGEAVYGEEGMDTFRAAVFVLEELIKKRGRGIVDKIDNIKIEMKDNNVECSIRGRVLVTIPKEELFIAAGLKRPSVAEPLPGRVIYRIDNFPERDEFSDFLVSLGNQLKSDEVSIVVKNGFGIEGIKGEHVKTVEIDYRTSGSKKHIFKITLELTDAGRQLIPEEFEGKLVFTAAAKIPRPHYRKMDVEEIEAFKLLKNTGLVPTFYGETELEGVRFYIEEWIEGPTVAEYVGAGELNPGELVDIVAAWIKAGAILKKFSKDMNAANIMFRSKDTSKKDFVIVDFGVLFPLDYFSQDEVINILRQFYILGSTDLGYGMAAVRSRTKSLRPILLGIIKALGVKDGKDFLDGALRGRMGRESALFEEDKAEIRNFLEDIEAGTVTVPAVTGNIASGLEEREEAQLRQEAEARTEEVLKANEDAADIVETRCAWLLVRHEEEIRQALEDFGITDKKEIDRAINALKNPRSPDSFKWFEAVVEGREKYMLGNESALAVNVIRHLIETEEKSWQMAEESRIDDLLDEYILHEVLEKIPNLDHYSIIGLTTIVFDREIGFNTAVVNPGRTRLGRALRNFIDDEAAFKSILDDLIVRYWEKKGDERLRGNLKRVLAGIRSLREAEPDTLEAFFRTHFDNEFMRYYDRELARQRSRRGIEEADIDMAMRDFIRDHIQVTTVIETGRFEEISGDLAQKDWVLEKLTRYRGEPEVDDWFKETLTKIQEQAEAPPEMRARPWRRSPPVDLITVVQARGKRLYRTGRALVSGLDTDQTVVPIPDVHADLEALRDFLEGAGLIARGATPEEDVWIARGVVAVQMGDIIDRGPSDPLRVMGYLRRMQKEAAENDSKLVRLLGNHEIAYLLRRSRGLLDRRRVEHVAGKMDKNLLDNEDFINGLAEDVLNGDLVAAYEIGGKVFAHGVITRDLVEYIKGERDTLSRADFVKEANEAVKRAVQENDYSHPIFNFGPRVENAFENKGVRIGLFMGYITRIDGYGYGEVYSEFEQVVGHDMGLAVIKTSPDGKIICTDVAMSSGMYKDKRKGMRVGLIFDKGLIYMIAPPVITSPAARIIIEELAEEVAKEQVNTARGAMGDLRAGIMDWVISPMNEEMVSVKASVDSMAGRKFREDYGSETLMRGYLYKAALSDAALAYNLREVFEKVLIEMQKPKYMERKPRAIVFVPAERYELARKTLKDTLKELKLETFEERIAVIKEENIPENGVIDEVMHVVLGKALLNYERFRKGDFVTEFGQAAKMRLERFLKSLVSDPGAIDIEKDPEIISKILNGIIALRIMPIDFTEIRQWKVEQDAVLKAL